MNQSDRGVRTGKKEHMKRSRTYAALSALVLSAAAALSGCGGDSIENTDTGAAGAEDCGTLNMAVNNWVGYEADAYVVGRVAETRLGCTVEYKRLDEQVSWKGFGTGEVDVVIENWGHPELQSKYMADKGGDGSATDFGLTGNDGIIGWYVPPWMVEEYPDITNWENLNKYSDLFQTSETGDKGTFYDGDPGFVTNDEAIIKNLDLDFEVVYTGSETALIEGFRKAEQNQTPYIGYFYEPQWFLSEVPLVHVDLPEWQEGDPVEGPDVATDYPPYPLNKVVSTEWAESGSPAVDLVKNFQWTNEDQNLVAKYIAEDGMEPADAADKWIEDNPDKVDAWLDGSS
jgi:glycine betaine/proline transport system substrate-binding protein